MMISLICILDRSAFTPSKEYRNILVLLDYLGIASLERFCLGVQGQQEKGCEQSQHPHGIKNNRKHLHVCVCVCLSVCGGGGLLTLKLSEFGSLR